MWIKSLIAFMLLGNFVFAQKPNEQTAVNLLNEALQKVKALSDIVPSCLICQLMISSESSKTDQSKVCNDLFAASCLKPNGESKYADRLSSLKLELNKSIVDARNKTAMLMGFKDFDDALKARLKENGLEIKDPLDVEAWKELKREDGYFRVGDAPKRLYTSVDQCYKDKELVKSVSYDTLEKDSSKLTEILKNYDKFLTKYGEKRISLYAKDLPKFINDLSIKCRLEETKDCKNFSQIKRQAINLFRIEGTPQYKEQAEMFVREFFLSEKKPSSTLPITARRSSEKEIRKKLDEKNDLALNLCENYSSVASIVGNKVFEDFTDEINKAKPTVDAIIDSFYSDSKKKMATRIFQEARSDVQMLVSQFVKNPAKKTEIVDGYDRLKLFWMEKPKNTSYAKNAKGIMSLDESKAGLPIISMLFNDTLETFSDPSLSFFTTFNADYMPSVTMGKTNKNERVNMMPANIYFMEKNPYNFLAAIAHEVGHKIGPGISKLNGYDLTSEYGDLLACYKDPKSINLQKGQEDETIADYISSEVLAREISKLPSEKRQQALLSSMEVFCMYAEEESQINTKESHPIDYLRVNGVYGASPNLRKAVGCDVKSPNFKSCGLKEVTLPLNAIPSDPISQSKGVQ